jgi:hypothetical protein
MCIVDFKFKYVYFTEIHAQTDLIVEYFITIVESSLVLRQPDKITFTEEEAESSYALASGSS